MDDLSSSFFLSSLDTVHAASRSRKTQQRAQRRLIRRLTLLLSELFVIQTALAVSCILPLAVHADSLRDAFTDPSVLARWLAISVAGLLTGAAFGLYSSIGSNPLERFYRRAYSSLLWPCLALGLAALRGPITVDIAVIVVTAALLAIPLGLMADAIVRGLLIARGLWGEDVILIGSGAAAGRVALDLLGNHETGLMPIGFYGGLSTADEPVHVPRLGSLSDVRDGAALSDIAVVVASPETQSLDITYLPFDRVVVVPESGGVPAVGLRAISIGAVPGFDFVNPARVRLYELAKRVMDLVVAVPVVLLVAPAIFCVAAAICVISPGPVFYVQERVGWKGRPVRIFKLRSMYTDADRRLDELLRNDPAAREEWQTYVKLANDPRILPLIGNFIRRLSVDELPQLWNVIRGDISLVGPRPLPQYHVEKFGDDFQRMRRSVRPGLTGLWQVSLRNSADLRQQEIIDRYYIRNWSLLLDIYILLRTGPAVLSTRGAR